MVSQLTSLPLVKNYVANIMNQKKFQNTAYHQSHWQHTCLFSSCFWNNTREQHLAISRQTLSQYLFYYLLSKTSLFTKVPLCLNSPAVSSKGSMFIFHKQTKVAAPLLLQHKKDIFLLCLSLLLIDYSEKWSVILYLCIWLSIQNLK